VFAPAGTALRTLARVVGQRWRIEQSFELAKGEVGLDHYELRRWDGWYRRMTLALFALASRAVLRARLPVQPAPPTPPAAKVAKGGPYQQPIDLSVELLPLTVPEIRHVLWAVGQADSAEATSFVFAWSHWRRRHQAQARRCHYQRHLAHL
jgi:hypothetical protein